MKSYANELTSIFVILFRLKVTKKLEFNLNLVLQNPLEENPKLRKLTLSEEVNQLKTKRISLMNGLIAS